MSQTTTAAGPVLAPPDRETVVQVSYLRRRYGGGTGFVPAGIARRYGWI
ncbi:hypothetical protein [Plantactinospora sp. B24E8]